MSYSVPGNGIVLSHMTLHMTHRLPYMAPHHTSPHMTLHITTHDTTYDISPHMTHMTCHHAWHIATHDITTYDTSPYMTHGHTGHITTHDASPLPSSMLGTHFPRLTHYDNPLSLFPWFYSATIIKQWPKTTQEKKGFIWLTGCSLSTREIRVGTPCRNLEADTEAWTKEECCLLSSSGLFSCLPYTPQTHLPRDVPQTSLQANLMGAITSWRSSSPVVYPQLNPRMASSFLKNFGIMFLKTISNQHRSI